MEEEKVMKYTDLVNKLRQHSPIAKYREMGSRNKKTGKVNHYTITRHLVSNSFTCSCPAADFRRYQECKHVRRLKEKLRLY
tara:strand:- start:158 stop:400 length:243 start_codon:yes stop_codon:yes gene_type:complete